MKIIEKIVIGNPLGLCLKNVSELVRLSNHFECKITVLHRGRAVETRSIRSLLDLEAIAGAELTCCFEGRDAREALDAYREFFR